MALAVGAVAQGGDFSLGDLRENRLFQFSLAQCLTLPDPMEQKKQMTIQNHLVEMQRQHRALEKNIAEELKHKSTDDLEIVELKRQKLHLKDEIERLMRSAAP